jgi:benzoyl-CoA reductase subunit A
MNVFLGIDLGSTTSKAVIVDSEGHIIGRGITNTRSNYEVAAQIAQNEAEFNSRFTLLHRKLKSEPNDTVNWDELIDQLENRFHYLQYKYRFHRLLEKMFENATQMTDKKLSEKINKLLNKIQDDLISQVKDKFISGDISLTSEFFRDLFSTGYMKAIQDEDKDYYDQLVALYDRSITPVENEKLSFDFAELAEEAIELLPENSYQKNNHFRKHLEEIESLTLEPSDYIGTGYGRQLLPFEEKHIKSEILCHAMGAHACFPETRTVLDIGGQDTKAIQVDKYGLVTSFQMNDRCAAGCGRYLGYIADEMSISVGELGPLAMNADHEANICSTCTVFAGAELREYLNLGEKKENILAGLHKAIVQRAFALLARSGGVRNEFTFTGGVARNQAVVKYVSQIVEQNYGRLKINCHTDSIFMGALGAALFSSRRK